MPQAAWGGNRDARDVLRGGSWNNNNNNVRAANRNNNNPDNWNNNIGFRCVRSLASVLSRQNWPDRHPIRVALPPACAASERWQFLSGRL